MAMLAATCVASATAGPLAVAGRVDDRGELFARWNAAHGDAYALDDVDRFVDWDGGRKPRIECNRAAMVAYSGTSLHYAGAVLVDPAFRERLVRFEALVKDIAESVYGSATGPLDFVHQRFLHTLTQRLEERPDIFRILIGPGHGHHDDHFHFDASPWRYVDL